MQGQIRERYSGYVRTLVRSSPSSNVFSRLIGLVFPSNCAQFNAHVSPLIMAKIDAALAKIDVAFVAYDGGKCLPPSTRQTPTNQRRRCVLAHRRHVSVRRTTYAVHAQRARSSASYISRSMDSSRTEVHTCLSLHFRIYLRGHPRVCTLSFENTLPLYWCRCCL